ncbi:MAG: hypothetical protein M3P01_05120 [Actinomycetota bacterium]|nr:hypothetical protein [Actinomycetota bacterium]
MTFACDRTTFLREFPELELVKDYPHTHVWYLASGVSFRQFLPDRFVGILSATERLLSPFDKWIALRHTIVLHKFPRADDAS